MRSTSKDQDPYAFRNRGLEFSRLDAFSDVVFGFALTLLVVSLEVPKTFDELKEVMRGFVPFAVCFSLLLLVWHAHYKFFRRYGLQDAKTLLLNMILLFVVLFYVYPLKFLFTYLFDAFTGHTHAAAQGGLEVILRAQDTPTLMVIYGLGFAATFTTFALLYRHAIACREGLELNEVEVYDTKSSIIENAILAGIGLFSAALAVVLPTNLSGLSGYVYFFIGVGMWIHGARSGRGRRMLIEKLSKTTGAAAR